MNLPPQTRTMIGLTALAAGLVAGCADLMAPAHDPANGWPASGAAMALATPPPEIAYSTLKTKSDLPPVIPTLGDDLFKLPDIMPPGNTEIRPPQPVHLLAGRVSGHPTRQVQALSLAGGRNHFAEVREADNTFEFTRIDPWYYQMALVGPQATLLIRKVVVVEPARPVFIHIEVQPGGTAAKVDGLAVPVDVR